MKLWMKPRAKIKANLWPPEAIVLAIAFVIPATALSQDAVKDSAQKDRIEAQKPSPTARSQPDALLDERDRLWGLALEFQERARWGLATTSAKAAFVLEQRQLGMGHRDVRTTARFLAVLHLWRWLGQVDRRDAARFVRGIRLDVLLSFTRGTGVLRAVPDIVSGLRLLQRLSTPKGEPPEVADLLLRERDRLWDLGGRSLKIEDYSRAVAAFEAVLVIEQGLLLGQHEIDETLKMLVQSLSHQALNAYRSHDFGRAVQAAEEILFLIRPRATAEEIEVFLNFLATAYNDSGDSPSELRVRREYVRRTESRLGAGHHQVVTARLALTDVERRIYLPRRDQKRLRDADSNELKVVTLNELGRYNDALPMAREILEVRRKLLGNDSPAYARSLINLAAQLNGIGDAKVARPLLEEACANLRRTHGADHPAYANALSDLGELLRETGNLVEARPLLEQARDILAVHEQYSGAYATCLISLADCDQVAGREQVARQQLERARDLRGRDLGQHHPKFAGVLLELARSYRRTNDEQAARPLLEQAREILAALDRRSPAYAQCLADLAWCCESLGDYREARRRLEEALAVWKSYSGAKTCAIPPTCTTSRCYYKRWAKVGPPCQSPEMRSSSPRDVLVRKIHRTRPH